MTAAGMAISEESNRSSIPPCPGRIRPLSLMPNVPDALLEKVAIR